MSPRRILVERMEQRSLLSAGDLDPHFGDHGIAFVPFAEDIGFPIELERLTGGKLQATIYPGDDASLQIAHVRFLSSGKLDRSFGNGGIDVRPYHPPKRAAAASEDDFFVSATANQSNGKLIEALAIGDANAETSGGLRRLNRDGTLDRTFGDGGLVEVNPGGNQYTLGVVVLPDDRIVALNSFEDGDSVLVGFTRAGKLDPQFGDGGYQSIDDYGNPYALDMFVTRDNRILVTTWEEESVRIDRFTFGGLHDARFGVGGVSGVASFDGSNSAFALTRDALFVATEGASPSGDASGLIVAKVQLTPPQPITPVGKLSKSGVLTVAGTASDDAINVQQAYGLLSVEVNGQSELFNVSSVRGIEIDGAAGDDNISATDSVTAHMALRGGGGNDTLTGGSRADVLAGGDGDDSLDGGKGDDKISGGDGRDRLVCRSGRDTVHGDGGDDTLINLNYVSNEWFGDAGKDSLEYGTSRNLTLSLNEIADDGIAGENDNIHSDIESLYGGSGKDLIIGDDQANYLFGGDNHDRLIGGGGNDTLEGGRGNDRLFGQAGDDLLLAQDRNQDTLDGGDGLDAAQRDDSAMVKDVVMNIETFV